jgi:hypothetical protein
MYLQQRTWKSVYACVYTQNAAGRRRLELYPSERDFDKARRALIILLDGAIAVRDVRVDNPSRAMRGCGRHILQNMSMVL